ncbi:MAG: DUF3489 domain-containing protein [Novosphingobium sp.]|uniref:DUF3489 domain-containing protein n=1 Tax=Novosphingobium sp. TaxID=1874826 RepID=UPI003C7C4242
MTDMIEGQRVTSKPATKRPRKMAREPQTAPSAPTEPRVKKSNLVIGLLQRPGGATLEEMIAATGWLPHTTRAALTGLKKKGRQVTSEKTDGVRRYLIESSNP